MVFFISLRSSSSRRFNIDQPVDITTNPPPTWTTGREIPKKASMCAPVRYEPTRRKKLFNAIRRASALLALGEKLAVSVRKNGLAPSGFTTGKIVLTTRKIFLRISDNLKLSYQQSPDTKGCTENAQPLIFVNRGLPM